MATASPPTDQPAAHPLPLNVHLQNFWRRVTEGLEVSQLWSQFESEARASYRLYSHDVAAKTPEGLTRRGHHLHVVKEFFWAVFEKLSPARRVLLLVALILLIIPHAGFQYSGEGGKVYTTEFDLHFWGALILLLLLILEIGDRVVMKRDLQIAREIQTWLLPGTPPQIPGLTIAYATRPANTVAGDYYDVFPRPGKTAEENRVVLAVADVAGKSIPAAMLMATFQASLKTLSTAQVALPDLAANMNRYACSNSQGGLRFTTAFLAEYDTVHRGFHYINAGHHSRSIPTLAFRSPSRFHRQYRFSTAGSVARCATIPVTAPPGSYSRSLAAELLAPSRLPTAPESCPREEIRAPRSPI